MIVIQGQQQGMDVSQLSAFEQSVYWQKQNSRLTYEYPSIDALKFELSMRSSMVQTAQALQQSGVKFLLLENSRANPMYWSVSPKGELMLRSGVNPADAMRDIYSNGRMYGFECATAMVAVMYQAVLSVIGDERFNQMFSGLVLYDWRYDPDLYLTTVATGEEAFPGDIQYFSNPDVSPQQAEWQGENVVVMGNDRYFGHGIGIESSADIIAELNTHRRPGSRRSAYLRDQVTHPDYIRMYQNVYGFRQQLQPLWRRYGGAAYTARVGRSTYIGRAIS